MQLAVRMSRDVRYAAAVVCASVQSTHGLPCTLVGDVPDCLLGGLLLAVTQA
jgi:hypothetical protein